MVSPFSYLEDSHDGYNACVCYHECAIMNVLSCMCCHVCAIMSCKRSLAAKRVKVTYVVAAAGFVYVVLYHQRHIIVDKMC